MVTKGTRPESPEGAVNGCLIAHLEEIKEKIGKNIELAGGAIRTTGGYAGPLLILNGYNPTLFFPLSSRERAGVRAFGGSFKRPSP